MRNVINLAQVYLDAADVMIVVLGPDEWSRGECKLKDLGTGEEKAIKFTDLPQALRSR